MNLKQTGLALVVTASLALSMPSCTSQAKKDAEAKAKIEAMVPGATVEVKDGVVTLKGELSDETARTAAADAAKSVAGVKSVVNNTTVTPAPAPAPVVISADEALTTAANNAIKEYQGVTAAVKDGIVTLTGKIKKADLPKLMQTLHTLQPKKIENKLTIE